MVEGLTGDWGILLDLDQTLVITAELESLRRRRAWVKVYRAFPKTSLPPSTREFLRSAKDLGSLGVVTTSPRAYAERLLAYHALDLPVIIAYDKVVTTVTHLPDSSQSPSLQHVDVAVPLD